MKTVYITCDRCGKKMERAVNFVDAWDIEIDTHDDDHRVTLELCDDCQKALYKWLEEAPNHPKPKKKNWFSKLIED